MLLFFLPLLASMRCWCCCFVLQGDAALAAPASSAVLASQSEGGVSGLFGHSSADFKSGEEVVDSNATSMPQAMAKSAAPVAVGSEASAMTPHHNPHHPRPRRLLQPPPPPSTAPIVGAAVSLAGPGTAGQPPSAAAAADAGAEHDGGKGGGLPRHATAGRESLTTVQRRRRLDFSKEVVGSNATTTLPAVGSEASAITPSGDMALAWNLAAPCCGKRVGSWQALYWEGAEK